MPTLRCLLLLLLTAAVPLRACATTQVAAWNRLALESMSRSGIGLLEIERAMAITQMAIFEAANATHPAYARGRFTIAAASGASVEAAVIEAAFQALSALEHPLDPALKSERDARLAAIPDAAARQAGMQAGAAAAEAVLQWRRDDGADWSVAYTPGKGPGAYQPTSDRPMAGPSVFHMRPFVLTTYAELRPPPPPPLNSPQMRRDLQETSTLGALHSTLRTPEQAEIGLFHVRPGVFGWTDIARQTSDRRGLDEVHAAYLLAAVQVAILESHFAVWEAKYFYNLWRPVTAIRAGGGPLHLPDNPAWESLSPAPMIPEYPCAHCGLGAAAQVVLEGLAGVQPESLTVVNGDVTRHYTSFRQYAEEESISRIYCGVHLRWSNYTGEIVGRQVGERVLASLPRPLAP